MTLINSHYVHVEDIPRIPRCHENLAGLWRPDVFFLPSPPTFRTRMRICGKIRLARETTGHHHRGCIRYDWQKNPVNQACDLVTTCKIVSYLLNS